MTDIGIREQKVIRSSLVGSGDALRQGPQFPGPSFWQRVTLNQGQALKCAQGVRGGGGRLRRAVSTAVIDDDDLDAAVECLLQKRTHRGPDQWRLVACRNEDNDPSWCERWW